jgi:hypothetical protein
MAITYNWTINPLQCYPTASENRDVVYLAHWQLTATSGSYIESIIGVQPITYSQGSTFIPFQDLTLEIVQGWVENAIGNDALQMYKDNLDKKIQERINPTSATLKSPWIDKVNVVPKIQTPQFDDDEPYMSPPLVVQTIAPPPGLIKLI